MRDAAAMRCHIGRRAVVVGLGGVYEAAARVDGLFKDRGYSETSMAHIASAAGIPVSGIYRYFSGKCEILATGLRRAADRVSGQLSPVLGALTEPRQALSLLIDAYVATSFANPELAAVYYTERVNLTPADQTLLHNVQLSTIDSWVRLLTAARPSLTPTQARFLVHAAMALVVDLGRMGSSEISADQSAYTQACVRKLMEVTLFGPEAAPSSRSAASTASAGTSRVFEPKSCRAPVISTTSVGAEISAAASRSSAGVPNGSEVPWVNTVGTVMSGRCSVRARSGLPGGCTG